MNQTLKLTSYLLILVAATDYGGCWLLLFLVLLKGFAIADTVAVADAVDTNCY